MNTVYARWWGSNFKQTYHSIQAVRPIPQRIPGTFVSLLYVPDMQDVYDTPLQEFGVIRFYA